MPKLGDTLPPRNASGRFVEKSRASALANSAESSSAPLLEPALSLRLPEGTHPTLENPDVTGASISTIVPRGLAVVFKSPVQSSLFTCFR
jgi:hypothetical protein